MGVSQRLGRGQAQPQAARPARRAAARVGPWGTDPALPAQSRRRIRPNPRRAGRGAGAAYPVWDVLFLALLVRLLAGLGARLPALRLLAGASALWLAYDTVYALVLQYGSRPGAPHRHPLAARVRPVRRHRAAPVHGRADPARGPTEHPTQLAAARPSHRGLPDRSGPAPVPDLAGPRPGGRDRDRRRLDVVVPAGGPADRRTGPAGGRAVRAARRAGPPRRVDRHP
jgi:hypothetical protein